MIPVPTPSVKRPEPAIVEAKQPEIYSWNIQGVLPAYGNRKFPKNVSVIVMAATLEDAIDKAAKHYGSITFIAVHRDRNLDRVLT